MLLNGLYRRKKLGAGEIVLNSIDADGTKDGYNINLTKMMSEALSIPVVASGGAGRPGPPERCFYRREG